MDKTINLYKRHINRNKLHHPHLSAFEVMSKTMLFSKAGKHTHTFH